MEDWLDREASSKAHLVRSCIEKPDTFIGLVCLNLFSSLLKPLPESLQQKDGDLVTALELISRVKTTLDDMQAHAETEFYYLYKEVENMAKNIDVAMKVVQPRIASRSVYQIWIQKATKG